jgi:hypothetical protein
MAALPQLVVSIEQARAIIDMSEGREPGPGHTKARHVTITKAELIQRNETIRLSGDIHFLSAFISIGDCAAALKQTIDALSHLKFVSNFNNVADGTRLEENHVPVPTEMKVRYGAGAGIIPVHHFHIAAVRMRQRPHGLHLITFYPTVGE